MTAFLKQFFAPPSFADDEKNRTASLLWTLLWGCLAGAILFALVAIITTANYGWVNYFALVAFVLIMVVLLRLVQRGYVRSVSVGLVAVCWLIVTLASLPDAGVRDPAFGGYLIVILIGGFLLGSRAAIFLSLLSTGLGLFMLYAEVNGLAYAAPESYSAVAIWAAAAVYFLLGALLLHLVMRSIQTSLNRAHQSEAALLRSNRAYQVLSDCNQILVRATDEAELFAAVCRAIIEVGGRRFVWVGLVGENGAPPLRPAAQAGQGHGYVDSIHEIGPDCDPTLTALQNKEITILRGVRTKVCSAAQSFNFDSIIALPLMVDGQVLGTLSVYSAYTDVFDSEEIALLAELAADLAFGIQTLRTRHAHQRMSLELAEQNQLLRTVLDNIPDVIFMKDAQGRYEVVNRTYLEYTGKSLEDVIGRTAYDLFPPEFAQEFHKSDMQRIRHGDPVTDLASRPHFNLNEPRWMLETQIPLRDTSGDVTRLLCIGRDLTERIQMEEQLRYQANLLENVSDAIVSINLNGMIMSWNAAAENIYGVPASAAIGRSLHEIVTTEFEGTSAEQALQNVMTAGIWKGEVIHKTPAGRILHIQAATSVIHDNQGTVTGLVSVNRDITDQKLAAQALAEHEHLQQELQHAQELSETRNRFVSMVSHEFRTPLAVIEMSTDMIERYWERMGPEKQQTHLRNIRSMVKRLDGLLADFTVVMRAESGHLTFKPSLIDIEQQVRQLIDEFRGALTEKHTIAYSAEGSLNEVMGDPVLLGYIVRNLVSNAIKYSPDGGDIQVELAQTGSQITLKVQDQGIGIPPNDLDKLFSAYHRAENVGTIPGTGLGLKIVKDCAALHGGRIEVSSELNRGTTFIVTLEIA